MIISYKIYKNSVLATIISLMGSAFTVCGVVALFAEPVSGLVCAAMGVGMLFWAKNISENKAFKKWWKQITDNHLEPQIAASLQTAIAIYNKNPQKRTLNKIRQLNPAAAQTIQDQLDRQKAQKQAQKKAK